MALIRACLARKQLVPGWRPANVRVVCEVQCVLNVSVRLRELLVTSFLLTVYSGAVRMNGGALRALLHQSECCAFTRKMCVRTQNSMASWVVSLLRY